MEIRLDIFVLNWLRAQNLPIGVSREKAITLIKSGGVFVNGSAILRPSRKISPKLDKVVVTLPNVKSKPIEESANKSELLNQIIIHENPLFTVINKPVGISVHPGAGARSETISDSHPFGIIHRIDKETSGCLLLANDDNFASYLAQAFQKRKVSKFYIAITEIPNKVSKINGFGDSFEFDELPSIDSLEEYLTSVNDGCLNKELENFVSKIEYYTDLNRVSSYFSSKLGKLELVSDGWLVGGWMYRSERQRYSFSLSYPARTLNVPKPAATYLYPLKLFNGSVIWLVKLITGRTHQIRAVMKYLEVPILGDIKYSNKASERLFKALGMKRMMLHSACMKFLISEPFTDLIKDFSSGDKWISGNNGFYRYKSIRGGIEASLMAKFRPTL